jgi:hypothetical protein
MPRYDHTLDNRVALVLKHSFDEQLLYAGWAHTSYEMINRILRIRTSEYLYDLANELWVYPFE